MPNLTQFIPQVLLLVIAAPTASPIAFGADVTHVFGLTGTTREESTAASSVTWYNIDDFRTGAHRGTLPFPSTGCCLQKDLPPLQASGHDTTMPNLTQFIPQVLLLVIAAPTASPIAFGADVTHVFGLAGTTREESTAASSVTWYNIDDFRTGAHRGTLPFPSTGCCLQKDLPPLQASGHDTTMPNLTQFIPQVKTAAMTVNATLPATTLTWDFRKAKDYKDWTGLRRIDFERLWYVKRRLVLEGIGARKSNTGFAPKKSNIGQGSAAEHGIVNP
ncbi:uncharacterized protein ISCGN_018762, partial [Ixodes scapularis]